jgi:integrase
MPKKLPKGVSVDRDRRDNVRLYFRAPGKAKVRLRETPGTKAFEREVACARLGLPYKQEAPAALAVSRQTTTEGTLDWLVAQYRVRAKNKMAPDQLDRRIRLLEEICDSKHKDKRRGALPFALMKRKHVIEIRDEVRDTAGAQNNVVKTVSAMFGWAVECGIMETNSALRIKDIPTGEGFHTWSVAEVEIYDAKYPIGTTARLAKDIAMFTGLRRKQAAILGRQHVRDGWIKITPTKTIKTSGVTVELPMLPVLAKTIAASKTGDLTFLMNEKGNAFTSNGLGNKFRDWCDGAGLPHCSMHGLRKAGATIAAENGATDTELMAIFGWTTKKQTEVYTRNANRKRMAGKAAHKLIPEQKEAEIVPLGQGLPDGGAKIAN